MVPGRLFLNQENCLSIFYFVFQKLCDFVSELLLEESNVQPLNSPVTVSGDIHGQVRQFSNNR